MREFTSTALKVNRRYEWFPESGAKNLCIARRWGKRFLAYLPEETVFKVAEVKGLKKITENTITSIDILLEELYRVKRRGYSIDDCEGEDGIKCVGAPIFDSNKEVVAAISIAGPAFRITGEKMETYGKMIVMWPKKFRKLWVM